MVAAKKKKAESPKSLNKFDFDIHCNMLRLRVLVSDN